MAWLAGLAGKAETLLNNLDEQTGAALRSHNNTRSRDSPYQTQNASPKKKSSNLTPKKLPPFHEAKSTAQHYGQKSTPKRQSRSRVAESQEFPKELSQKSYRGSSPSPHNSHYNLNHSPRTLVRDVKDVDFYVDPFGLKERRHSLPSDMDLFQNNSIAYKMQNLEVENAMLKNELNVTNKEVSELLDRLRKAEDGNDVDSMSQDLSKVRLKLEETELINKFNNDEKSTLSKQLEQLKCKINEITTVDIANYKIKNEDLQSEITFMTEKREELQGKLNELNDKEKEKNITITKLENEFRHSQSLIKDLQSELDKSKEECVRIEKEWEAYKLRVKSMLYSKDNQIKALQDGFNFNEDTKILMEEVEALKEEKEKLSGMLSLSVRECEEARLVAERAEQARGAAERVGGALRDALREERAARNKAEAQCLALGKELKTLQMETGQTIASLQTALRDKESEFNHLRDITSTSMTARSMDTSALNVADYDVMQDSIDNEKIQYLTQMLVQRQEKIDSLLANNNMLKIQIDKLETKHKKELAGLRTNNHSVVQLQDDVKLRPRNKGTETTLALISMRIGVLLRRYPIFRIFIVVYMIILHFWVLTVLLSNTPEDFIRRPSNVKSH